LFFKKNQDFGKQWMELLLDSYCKQNSHNYWIHH